MELEKNGQSDSKVEEPLTDTSVTHAEIREYVWAVRAEVFLMPPSSARRLGINQKE